jgi:hypothetical protein
MGLFVMKLYLDDERETPTGWDRVFTAWECIESLKTYKYEMVSLDHDLGCGFYDDDKGCRVDPGNGMDVLNWMEKEVQTNPSYVPPKYVLIHTANPTAKDRMMAARCAIFREVSRRAESNSTEGQR